MSLEQKIEALTKAIEANTKALGSGGGKPSSGGGSKPSSKGGTTIDVVAKKFSAYLAAEGDDGKANVRKIVKHFKAKKVTELPEDTLDDALAMLAKFEDGEDPFEDNEDLM